MKMVRSSVLCVTAIMGAIENVMFSGSAIAQLLPDSTVSTLVTGTTTQTVTGGARSGNNLFHSFSQFSVPTGSSAIFNNATDVQTIFSRVTGSQLSNIDGILKTQGNASLFLMNPNGIVFGPNARLDIGGSFIGTTAKSIQFSDKVEFGTTNLITNPLLTVTAPIGLQMGLTPSEIVVRSRGSGTIFKLGKGLTLAGGNIEFDAAQILIPGKSIELAGLAEPGTIALSSELGVWKLTPPTDLQQSTVRLSNGTRLDVSAVLGGTVAVKAENLILKNDSRIQAGVSGKGVPTQISGDITLDIMDAVRLETGTIANQAATGSIGSAGNILVRTGSFFARGGSRLNARTFGIGNAGNVIVQAREGVILEGASGVTKESLSTGFYASAQPGAIGNSGDITVTAKNLSLLNGARLSATSKATGNAGNISVNTTDIVDIDGIGPQGLSSGIYSFLDVGATGRGGNVNVNTRSLRLNNSGGITVGTEGNGNGGNIALSTQTLDILNGGFVIATSFSSGNAGDIKINATDSIVLSGTDATYLQRINADVNVRSVSAASGLYTNTTPTSTGKGGSLFISTQRLIAQDQAQIAVSAQGSKGAGSLTIDATSVSLSQAMFKADTVAGDQGSIQIRTSDLILRSGSKIITNAIGSASGGNIYISSNTLVGLDNSDIIANAVKGRGGNIDITTLGIFGLEFRSQLTDNNDITASSEFGINGNVQLNTIGINPASSLNALPSNVVDSSRQIADRCASSKTGSFMSTGRGGIPQNPSQTRKVGRTWHDLRDTGTDRSATTAVITPIAQAPIPLVEASAIQVDKSGAIALIAANPIAPNYPATCALSTTP